MTIREIGRRVSRDVKAVHGDVQAWIRSGWRLGSEVGYLHQIRSSQSDRLRTSLLENDSFRLGLYVPVL